MDEQFFFISRQVRWLMKTRVCVQRIRNADNNFPREMILRGEGMRPNGRVLR
jgi:hypothetical protein